MNKLLLWLVMLPSGLWRNIGADLTQLRAILHVKLLMDDRTPLQLGKPANKKSGKLYSLLQVFIFGILGFVFSFPLWFTDTNLLPGFTLYYSFFLFYLWFALVVSFSNVLIDTRDHLILLPKPVSERTLLLSRMLHISIYLFRMILPMSLPGWIIAGAVLGWAAVLLFPVPLFLLVMLALFLVNGVYVLIIRLAGPSRFRDVLNTFQILFSILLFGSYYLLPKMMDTEHPDFLSLDHYTWARWLPSYWFAAIWHLLYPVRGALPGTSILAVLGLLMPVTAIWVTIRKLAPKFTTALSGPEAALPLKLSGTKKQKHPLYRRLSRMINRNREAQAGFELTWVQTARNRAYKMRVYPTLAYVPIYFVWMFFNRSAKKDVGFLEIISGSQVYLVLLYLCTFALVTAVTHVLYSDQYKASWVYFAAPVAVPGRIMTGAFKAIYVKYYLPFAFVISTFVLAAAGWKTLPDIIIAQINILIYVLLSVRTGVRALPFSLKEMMKQQGGRNMLSMFLVFLVMPVLGFAHFLTIKFWLLRFIMYPLVIILFWMLWDSYKKTGWNTVMRADLD